MNNFENIINLLKKDLIQLKEENNNINLKIKSKNSIDSAVMEKGEFDMVKAAIKTRINKELKEIKKLYQATIDSGEAEIFHKKCDNIPNTLVLYKSAGNRRFGAFVSKCWGGENNYILDKNCFLFSLDRQKIYYPKNNVYFHVACYRDDGPSIVINGLYCIELYKNALQENNLKTFENNFKDIFEGDINSLSEDGNFRGVIAEEYEVFQIIFY